MNRVQFTKKWALGSIVILAVALQPLLIAKNQMIRLLTAAWWHGETNDFSNRWHEIDQAFSQFPGTNNLAVSFNNFSATNPDDMRFVAEFAHRGSYTLYPRKLFCAQDGQIIAGGESILNSAFAPSGEWLRDRDVNKILRFTQRGGEVALSVSSVTAAKSPSQAPEMPNLIRGIPIAPDVNEPGRR